MTITILLQTLLEEFHAKMKTFTGRILREASFSDISNKIMVAIGMRRTGKTYLMFHLIYLGTLIALVWIMLTSIALIKHKRKYNKINLQYSCLYNDFLAAPHPHLQFEI